jgi:hypothetical protein
MFFGHVYIVTECTMYNTVTYLKNCDFCYNCVVNEAAINESLNEN